MRNIATGNEVRILLNHAGGYREAIVVIRGLQVCSLTYPHAEEVKMPETENDETGTEETEDGTPQKVDPPENYEYLAFEWVDAHVMELNERCNESIAQGLSMLEITALRHAFVCIDLTDRTFSGAVHAPAHGVDCLDHRTT